MYSRKMISEIPSPAPRFVPLPRPGMDSAPDEPRCSADEWTEESSRQAAALVQSPPQADEGIASGPTVPAEVGIFAELRRKLAMGEALSRAVARLAEALRFSGRITVSFHQGRITKTVFEELHIRSTKAKGPPWRTTGSLP